MSDRRRRREERRAQRQPGIHQPPWRRLVRPYRPVEVLDEDQVEAIHDASMRILEDHGIEFQSREAVRILKEAGAIVEPATGLVRMGREMVVELVAKAPAELDLVARNPARNIRIGGNHVCFTPVASPPFCSDLGRGRRPGSYEDLCELLKLAQSLNVLHLTGNPPVEPVDLPAETRHLDTYYAFITLTDRIWHARAIGRERIEDAVNMLAIARGVEVEQLTREPGLLTVINVNSPRRVDGELLAGLMAMVRHGQPVTVTPFTLAGAMSPVTLAGALAQQNAEALAVIAFAQLVRPGAPVIYGGFTSNVDMRTGSPAFGTPEYVKCALAGGQLARRYRLPYRSSNVNASNAPDAQATWESAMSIWAAVMGGASLVYHGAGWLEGGLVASYEKMVIDAEMLGKMAAILEPIAVDGDSLALDAHAEVAPGGHFFGAAHTLARFETAFHTPLLADWSNHGAWVEAGSKDATTRAHELWQRLLAAYEQPAIEPAVDEALRDYVARRKREMARKLSA
jgi:trimethylamine---corrinoid protein Co-methyltransferase